MDKMTTKIAMTNFLKQNDIYKPVKIYTREVDDAVNELLRLEDLMELYGMITEQMPELLKPPKPPVYKEPKPLSERAIKRAAGKGKGKGRPFKEGAIITPKGEFATFEDAVLGVGLSKATLRHYISSRPHLYHYK